MNARQAQIIGVTVTDLLQFAARENLQLTTSGITVTEGERGGQNVTLHACRPSGEDYIVCVTVLDNGILLPTGRYQEWDAQADSMTEWLPFDALQIVR